MQLVFQQDYQALSREYSYALEPTTKDPFLKRREQRIIEEYLSVPTGDRVLRSAGIKVEEPRSELSRRLHHYISGPLNRLRDQSIYD